MKSAAVIGASTGLGLYIATALVAEGWQVMGAGRRLLPQGSEAFDYVQADLAEDTSVDRLSQILRAAAPELVVYCAVAYGSGELSPPSFAEMDAMFRVNALAPYRLIYDYLTTGSDEKFRSIVVVNSDSIYHASLQTGVYAASKAALRVLTSTLAHTCKTKNAAVATLLLGPFGR